MWARSKGGSHHCLQLKAQQDQTCRPRAAHDFTQVVISPATRGY
jgi:hypothetical protein